MSEKPPRKKVTKEEVAENPRVGLEEDTTSQKVYKDLKPRLENLTEKSGDIAKGTLAWELEHLDSKRPGDIRQLSDRFTDLERGLARSKREEPYELKQLNEPFDKLERKINEEEKDAEAQEKVIELAKQEAERKTESAKREATEKRKSDRRSAISLKGKAVGKYVPEASTGSARYPVPALIRGEASFGRERFERIDEIRARLKTLEKSKAIGAKGEAVAREAEVLEEELRRLTARPAAESPAVAEAIPAAAPEPVGYGALLDKEFPKVNVPDSGNKNEVYGPPMNPEAEKVSIGAYKAKIASLIERIQAVSGQTAEQSPVPPPAAPAESSPGASVRPGNEAARKPIEQHAWVHEVDYEPTPKMVVGNDSESAGPAASTAEALMSPRAESMRAILQERGFQLNNQAEKSLGEKLGSWVRGAGEWYKQQPFWKKAMFSGALAGLSVATGGAGAWFWVIGSGYALSRGLGAASTYVSVEGMLAGSNKKKERWWNKGMSRNVIAGTAGVLVGSGAAGSLLHWLGGHTPGIGGGSHQAESALNKVGRDVKVENIHHPIGTQSISTETPDSPPTDQSAPQIDGGPADTAPEHHAASHLHQAGSSVESSEEAETRALNLGQLHHPGVVTGNEMQEMQGTTPAAPVPETPTIPVENHPVPTEIPRSSGIIGRPLDSLNDGNAPPVSNADIIQNPGSGQPIGAPLTEGQNPT